MLLMIEKDKRGGRICHSSDRYAKANNNYIRDYDTNKEYSYIQYYMKKICMVGHCCKSF